MKTRSTTVYVRTQFENLHCWPKAPQEVAFLRHPHRHVFHVELHVGVTDDDREVEFFMLKRRLEETIQKLLNQNHMNWSCEMWSEALFDWAESCDDLDPVVVRVSEDNENGAETRSA